METPKRRAAVALPACLALLLSGCAGGAVADSSNESDVDVVLFTVAASHPYVAQSIRQAEESAEERGWSLEVIQNNFDQAEMDAQVQQYLASGEVPDAFLWFPADATAGINSTRQLSAVAPVFQMNQDVKPGGEAYVKAYVGANNILSGQVSGEELMRAREEDRASNRDLSSSSGNLLIFSWPPSLGVSQTRMQGFEDATAGEPFNVLETFDAGYSTEESYSAASTLVPKYREKGIDYVWAFGSNQATGVAQALRENGLEPGKDVKIVVGNCTGDLGLLEDGTTFSEGVQSPSLEAATALDVIARYLESGEIIPGAYQGENDAEFPELSGAPNAQTYIPNPSLTLDNLTASLWGSTQEDLCTY